MTKILLIAMAGGLGSLSRYYLTGIVHKIAGLGFPFGTFVVNLIGCFLFCLIWGFIENRLTIPATVRIVVLTGYMGAFTTFSTFIFETQNLLSHGQFIFAALNVIGQVVLGLGLAFAGLALGRAI